MNENGKESAQVDDSRPDLAEDELTDEELEAVVGGLTRPWIRPLLPMNVALDPL